MGNKNSYFKLTSKDDKLYIQIIAPESGGENIDIKEVMEYLSDQGLENYDLKDMNHAVLNPEKNMLVLVGNDGNKTVPETMKVIVSEDGMLVNVRFYAPSDNGKRITEHDLLSDLEYNKIKTGIKKEVVSRLMAGREYCTDYQIAEGILPTQGKDAQIEYFFSTNLSLKPKHNEDGSVNYHDLNTITSVNEGELLARLTKEVPGKNGKNVYGEDIKPWDVKKKRLSYANNIRLSEDETEIFSEITGHVSLVQEKVFVSGVFEVPADVDNSIGDINYSGNVNVKGNVKSGFIIHADGNIIVEGVVEGAELYAGGQIIVKRGIHGMGKGILSAKGNIIIKFIESATAKSGGYVETESILHSKVSAGSDVSVIGGKGFIMGGSIRAAGKVQAKTIGSEMGAATLIEVGVDPDKLEQYNQLVEQVNDINKKIDTIKPILANYSDKLSKGITIPADKIEFMKKNILALKTLQGALKPINDKIELLKQEFSTSSRAKIRVEKVVHPGVTIKISDISVTLKDSRKYCQFVKEGAEIKALNL